MKRRSDLLLRAGLAVLAAYAVMGGATATGLLTPNYRQLTMIMLAIIILIWLVVRWRGGWKWHSTPLDLPFALWLGANLISTLANLDLLPRILIGLWFTFLYIGLWYVLYDAVANKALKPEMLLDSLLIAGLIVMFFGYLQVFILWRAGTFSHDTVFGTLDNPDILAGFLVFLLPVAIRQTIITRQRIIKAVFACYSLATAALLIITDSRGALIGSSISLVTLVLLYLADKNMLSVSALQAWWHKQSSKIRAGVVGLSLIVLVVAVMGSVYILHSLSVPGRTLYLRTYIYDAAITLFKEKPLTGYGIFTFGRGLMRLSSVPPSAAQGHAHDLIFNVAAELGLLGLVAAAAIVFMVLWTLRRHWQTNRNRIMLISLTAALVGAFIHHLFDLPAVTSPLLMLVGLCVLVSALAPVESPRISKFPGNFLLAGAWIVILIAGIRTTTTYNAYVAALQDGLANSDLAKAATEMAAIRVDNPSMPIFYLYEGYFAGSHAKDDSSAIPQAISSYEHFMELEPYYAPAWANLAALYWQNNQREQAITAMQKAYDLAPQSWVIAYNYGSYQEQMGNTDLAKQAYQRALDIYPEVTLYPDWQQSELRRQLPDIDSQLTITEQVSKLIWAKSFDKAASLWEQASPEEQHSREGYVVSEILALGWGDRTAAQAELDHINTQSSEPDIWQHIGLEKLARYDGDQQKLAQELASIQSQSIVSSDDNRVGGIAYLQFWCVGIPDYFLPQIYHPALDPVAALLLDSDNR